MYQLFEVGVVNYQEQIDCILLMDDYNKMSGLSKRREMFVRQIRRKEQDLIKSQLRAKLLSDECTLDTRTSLDPFNEKSGNLMAQFQQEMMNLIVINFNNQTIENFNYGFALTIFFNSIKQIDHPQGIIHLTQCYRTAKSLIQKHLDLVSTNEYPNSCDLANYYEEMNRWSHVLNIVLLRIKLKSRAFPKEILEIDGYFNQWLNQTLEDLEAYQQADDLKLIMEGKDINFTLKQIYSIFWKDSEDYKTEETRQLLERIFGNKMVKLLVSSLRNLRIDDTCRLTIIYIFLELTERRIKTVYQRIIDHDFIEYIRMTLVISEGYKAKRKSTHSHENQTKIVSKMCEFIIYAAELDFSNIFWQRCVCSELKEVERSKITDSNMRYYIISTLFVCITNINNEKTLDLMKEADIFDWVLKVIDQMIDLNSTNPDTRELIDEGVDVIHFFLEIGECNMNGATINPYKIKLQYSSGESVLSRCEKGRWLLQKYGFETDLNPC